MVVFCSHLSNYLRIEMSTYMLSCCWFACCLFVCQFRLVGCFLFMCHFSKFGLRFIISWFVIVLIYNVLNSKKYDGTELLIIYDPEFCYDTNFIACLTESAKANYYEVWISGRGKNICCFIHSIFTRSFIMHNVATPIYLFRCFLFFLFFYILYIAL